MTSEGLEEAVLQVSHFSSCGRTQWIRSRAGAQCNQVCDVKIASLSCVLCMRVLYISVGFCFYSLSIILTLSFHPDAYSIFHMYSMEDSVNRPDQSSRSQAAMLCGAAGQETMALLAAAALHSSVRQ